MIRAVVQGYNEQRLISTPKPLPAKAKGKRDRSTEGPTMADHDPFDRHLAAARATPDPESADVTTAFAGAVPTPPPSAPQRRSPRTPAGSRSSRRSRGAGWASSIAPTMRRSTAAWRSRCSRSASRCQPIAISRFVEEGQITGQLQHPGIPAVHEIGSLADGSPYLAMKLVKGRTLADLIAEPAPDRSRLVAAFLQVAQAVAYAHSKGVIHRDLKPANVMVGQFGEVQVMDWGLAKILTPSAAPADVRPSPASPLHTIIATDRSSDAGTDTQAGSILGTPAFMSPEQAGGETERVDERADVFGLGAVLCTILTGEPPFIAGTTEAVRLQAVRGQVEDAHRRLDGCGADAELAALCKRCLTPDRDRRPRHAGAVATAVSAHLAAVEERLRQAERAGRRRSAGRRAAEAPALVGRARRCRRADRGARRRRRVVDGPPGRRA